jgi:hypothetical protein
MNARALTRRKPVWLALSEFYLDTELQPADFERIRAVFDQSGYSEQEIRQIDYDEVGPLLYPNLLSVAGEWIAFEETTLLDSLARRAIKRGRLRRLPPFRWLWRKSIDFFNQTYFQRIYPR